MKHKKTHKVWDSYTRPANTTQYTANDAMSDSAATPTALEFAWSPAHGNNRGWILNVFCRGSANQATLPSLKLYLFDGDTAPTATNDNAEFNLTDANLAELIGIINLDAFEAVDPTAGADGNCACTPSMNQPIAFELESGNTTGSLWGLVRVENAYTPVSGEIVTFILDIEQD